VERKELVKKAMRGRETARPPFIPLLGTYLTKVDQISVEELLSDAGALCSSLINTQQLFGYDAVTLPMDTTWEAEAFGVTVDWSSSALPTVSAHLPWQQDLMFRADEARIPVYLEAAKRFIAVHGKKLPIFAVISSPLTVFQRIFGVYELENIDFESSEISQKMNVICQALIGLCKRYGELKVDGIIVNEDDRLNSIHLQTWSKYYKPIFSVIRYFNITGLLRLPSDVDEPHLWQAACAADGFLAPMRTESTVSTTKGIRGVALPQHIWSEDQNQLRLPAYFRECGKKGIFLSTAEPLNQEIRMEALQQKIAEICEESYWMGM
jgi:hypothetical protein